MNESKLRASIIVGVLGVFFVYLIVVLYNIQVRDHESYSLIRKKQNEFVNKETKRGSIYGTLKNGELFPLAQDQTWYKLVISPKDIPSSYETRLYQLINEISPIERSSFFKKMENKKDSYEEFKIISEEEREKIESLGIRGVFTYESFKRDYPLKEVGGRIIGFVGGGDTGFEGRYGLEKFYENDLVTKEEVNASFFTKIFDRNSENKAHKMAKNIVTSLEPNSMRFLNKMLLEMKDSWAADEVSAIIMEVETGKIVAMDTVPEFDPNKYSEYDIKLFGNPSIQGVYELGSIMKPITLSGALDSGLITPESKYLDKGFVKVDEYTIWNFDNKSRGEQTMQDVISNSLNTGAVYVQKLMGKDKFKENYEKFGLNKSTGIDFPGEVSNKNDNLETHTEVNFATASFGQGVAVTPISMLSSLNIISNNGREVCPHFLNKKVLSDGSEVEYECVIEANQVVSSTTANTMKEMLIELIDSGLARGHYKDANYKVGAKTGTAQLPSPDGKYYKDKFIHSYFTFIPGDNPKFAVLIYQVNPKQGSLASLTLAPFASKIKDFLVTYYNIPPDRI